MFFLNRNLNHLRDLSFVGYIALIPVAFNTECFCLVAIYLVRYISLGNAIISGNLERIKIFLGWMKSVDRFFGLPDEMHVLRLHLVKYVAISKGHTAIGADLNNGIAPTRGTTITPLSAAIYLGELEAARYLLDQGEDRDKVNSSGETPLHQAVDWGKLEITKLLMIYGADLNATTNDGRLPIDIARNQEMKQAIRDEPRRRMDHGFKRAIELDPYSSATAVATEQENDESSDDEENDD